MLGAAIVLPDHPQIAPESRGNLFDNTEIEEALLLHVHALSDGERERTPRSRPGRRARCSSARSRRRPRTSSACTAACARCAVTAEAAARRRQPPAAPTDNPGEERATVDGVTFERGATASCCVPAPTATPSTGCSTARRATLERIYVDYDDRVYLAVTVDDDPGQELMRETGRYLFFFANEVAPL